MFIIMERNLNDKFIIKIEQIRERKETKSIVLIDRPRLNLTISSFYNLLAL